MSIFSDGSRRLQRPTEWARNRELRFEPLESRRLLAADFDVVKNILTLDVVNGYNPAMLVEVSNHVFFTARTQNAGQELWKSDGTVAGTVVVKDITSGLGDTYMRSLTNVEGTLYFFANDGVHGLELWKSDGTATGTVMVRDINPGSSGSYGGSLTNAGGTLFFQASSGAGGAGLFKSNGTDEGTVLLPSGEGGASYLTAVGGLVYFTSPDLGGIRRLWKSDGTPEGTTRISPELIGARGGAPRDLVELNGALLFWAWNDVSVNTLWRSDGTAAGTVVLRDFTGSDASSHFPVNVSGTLYFRASDAAHGYELWKSDGTTTGTLLVRDIRPGSAGGLADALPQYGDPQITNVGGRVFFAANDGAHGRELWTTDGSSAGTTMVTDLRPGAANTYIHDLVNFGGTLYFVASDDVAGAEVRKTDGTADGTVLLKDIRAGIGNSTPSELTVAGGKLYFTTSDPTDVVGPDINRELWVSDGSSGGTRLALVDVAAHSLGANPRLLGRIGETLFFSANDGVHGSELWKSDGTAAGTVMVKDIRPGPTGAVSAGSTGSPQVLAVGEVLYFVASDETTGAELWRTDGTSTGTWLVRDIKPLGDSFPTYLTNVSGTLYFVAEGETANSKALWKSDGTTGGTVLVKLFTRPMGSPNNAPLITDLINANGTLLFIANDAAHGQEIWRSDGTLGGTEVAVELAPGSASVLPTGLVLVGEKLFFRGTSPGSGLWTSDGTQAGTQQLIPGPQLANLAPSWKPTVVGDALFFVAGSTATGFELWQTDGSPAGTTLVKDIRPGANSSSPRYLVNVNGVLYFTAIDGTTGFELWRSDGTPGGTILVKDIRPEAADASPRNLQNVDGTLYFTAADSAGMPRFFESDGTSAGTFVAASFSQGFATAPDAYTQVQDRMFAVAISDEFDQELWVRDLIPALLGDFDVDQDVDGADLLKWQRQMGYVANPVGSRADANRSGVIDGGDLDVWRVRFGERVNSVAAASSELAVTTATVAAPDPQKAFGESSSPVSLSESPCLSPIAEGPEGRAKLGFKMYVSMGSWPVELMRTAPAGLTPTIPIRSRFSKTMHESTTIALPHPVAATAMSPSRTSSPNFPAADAAWHEIVNEGDDAGENEERVNSTAADLDTTFVALPRTPSCRLRN
ncbi:ELWxxDGT repeat protein [Lacipirellula limnantheis]|uniref:Uncharacterized protein n=1 Tax=Lacipirellula limnantheis TaxID=2528024 RepID=A0A517TTN0_9BACT|nr:ELWxxDGT repeat protein [Lacipirellula limnantheis]QDT71734.1 hypothetical protein I41_08940 [Lacipirellula limnantheis]